MSLLSNVPRWAVTLFWLLVAVIVIILVALVVHHLGGFLWSLRMGHFILRLGVT